jgi:hypothetical protein
MPTVRTVGIFRRQTLCRLTTSIPRAPLTVDEAFSYSALDLASPSYQFPASGSPSRISCNQRLIGLRGESPIGGEMYEEQTRFVGKAANTPIVFMFAA